MLFEFHKRLINTLSITHTAFCGFCDQIEGIFVCCYGIPFICQLQLFYNLSVRNCFKLNLTTSGKDCRRDLLQLRRTKNKYHGFRRLLQNFKKCIKSSLGEHMYLIKDNNTLLPVGLKSALLDHATNGIHSII